MCTRPTLVANNKLKIMHIDNLLLKKFYETVKKFARRGYQIIVTPMGLGEPLMYPGLFDFIASLKKISSQINLVIVTNGLLLNPANCQKILDSGLEEISISLNASNSQQYLREMGVNSFDLVVANITNFLKMRNDQASKLRIYIQYLDFDSNQSEYLSHQKIWSQLMNDSDKHYLHPIVNQAGYFDGETTIKTQDSYPCTAPMQRLVIKINGDVYPCDACLYNGQQKNHELILGNLRCDDLYKIFTSKKGKSHQILKLMKQGDYRQLSTCAKCTTYQLSTNCHFKLPLNLTYHGQKWI